MSRRNRDCGNVLWIALAVFVFGLTPGWAQSDPPEVTIGERLFLETRFAQFFKNSQNAINQPLVNGDPTMNTSQTTGAPLPGPFAGQSMNCRACHLVDEQVGVNGGGMRTYTDFARRSPIPVRSDNHTNTVRNSPPLVNSSLDRPGGILLHFDGEFSSLQDLVIGTLTGRNYGYLPGEKSEAIAHVARVIRNDDGTGTLAQDFGGLSYRTVLTGTSPSIPKEFKLPGRFHVDVARSSDQEIVQGVAALIAAYVEQLVFSQDKKGNFNLSPFDVFVAVNGLPGQPAGNEDAKQYSRRLLRLINELDRSGRLKFVNSNPATGTGGFEFHTQPFRFGAQELQGLRIFLAEPAGDDPTASEIANGGIGNCIACHAAPNFTDFGFHNTGISQDEYDTIHGVGSFERLSIPSLLERQRNHNAYLPATDKHPNAEEIFRSIPRASDLRLADLGVWNVYLNPDIPEPQTKIGRILCEDQISDTECRPSQLLDASVARFKTPGLRDLSHSAPYFHNGQFDTLELVIDFYIRASALNRAGHLRNGAGELSRIALVAADVPALVAFLRSLNEDYS